MKKIIFIFLVLFSLNLIVSADSKFYLGDKVTDMYVESIKGNDKHNGAPFLIYRSDGSIVYCINPFKMMSEDGIYKSYTYNDKKFNLTDEELNKLNIIGYYGYGYSGHTDKKWYGITQYLMWKSLNFDDVYFTDSYYGSRVEKYTSEINELENLVNNYLKLPSFADNHYEFNPNTTNEIIDNNNVLSNYEIKESNIDATIDNNKLKIKAKEVGDYTITFVRKSPVNKNYELYSLENHQELLYPGKIENITFSISIRIVGGSIVINRLDKENKERLEANLSGSVIRIGNGSIWLRSQITDENGSVIFSNLAPGYYEIQEYRPSMGYEENIVSYRLAVYDGEVTTYNIYSKVIKGNLVINKYYGSENNYKLDNDSTFEIYYNNKLYKTLKPVNGVINEKLEYGTYVVKQVSGKKYYNLTQEFSVTVNKSQNYIYNFYTEMEDELKLFFDEKNNILEDKENELNNLHNSLIEEKEYLKNLKNELIDQENELKKENEKINKLIEEIEKDRNNLISKAEELKSKEKELIDLEEKLSLLNNDLTLEEGNLNEFKKKIEDKEKELNDLKKELDLLQNNLKEKENNLNQLKINFESKQKELEEKEARVTKLENDALIVEVPNTFKKSYNKLISKILIFIGSLIIICNRKKVTH